MLLYWSSRSPFARKVMVVVHELGLADQIRTERVVVSALKPNTQVMVLNPLAKLPTLVLDDGTAMFDSTVICEYLASLASARALYPASGPQRWTALKRQSLADGLLDTLLMWLMERAKEPGQQLPALIDGCRIKLHATLDALESDAVALERSPLDIGVVSTGVALGYVDFRFPAEDWRRGRPRLAAWHATFADRPSMTATRHADVY